jgi:MFS family permease
MSFFGSFGYDAGFSIWTTDISNEHNRGRLGGAIAVMPVIATIFGTIVSGYIVDRLDYFPFFVIMGAMVIVFGLVALVAMKDAPDLKPRRDEPTYWKQLVKVFNWRTVKENRELFWVFIVMLVYFIGFNVYFSYITIYFVNYLGYSYTIAGALQGGALVVASFMTIPAGRLIDKGQLARVIFYALIANSVGLVSIAFASHIAILCVGMFLAGCGYILTLQSLTAWIKNLYPEDQRGQFEGIKQVFFVALPMIFGPRSSQRLSSTTSA